MLFRKSAGAVVFYRAPTKEIEYLLLLHKHGDVEAAAIKDKKDYKERDYWNFPKGTAEAAETEFETAKREVAEETGLEELEYLPGFKTSERYFFRVPKDYYHKGKAGQLVFKRVVYYLAESKNKHVKISNEHISYEWLRFEDAFKRLSKFKSSQKILAKADEFLYDNFSEKSI